MALLLNLCLILVGLAGVGAAVAAPIVMSRSGGTSTTSGTSTVSVDISECSTSGTSSQQTVAWGDSSSGKKICWKVADSSSGSGSNILTHTEQYTELFKSSWGKTANEWNTVSYGDWKSECKIGNASHWEIWGSGGQQEQSDSDNLQNKEQAVGLCNGSTSGSSGDNDVPFAYNKDSGKSISVCVGLDHCWSRGDTSQTKQLQDRQESNWKTVNFYVSS